MEGHIFKRFVFNSAYVCMYVGMCMGVQVSSEASRSIGFPGSWCTGSCEPQSVGAGN